jgi:hypothetical protein
MLTEQRRRRLITAAAGACLLAGLGTTGAALASEFRATLSGDNEMTRGDTDGWGRARVRVDDTLNLVCTDLEMRDIGHVTSAQIMRGKEGEAGEPVVRLDIAQDGDSDDCDNVGDELADEIQSRPTDFFVEIKTSDFPNGALRGQLLPNSG